MREKADFLYTKGLTISEIAFVLEISRQRVHQIVKGYRTLSGSKLKKKLLSQSCRDCKNAAVNVHHNDFNSSNNNIENLIPLCRACHVYRHSGVRHKYDRGLYPDVHALELKVKEMWEQGEWACDIRDKLGIGKHIVYRVVKKYNLASHF